MRQELTKMNLPDVKLLIGGAIQGDPLIEGVTEIDNQNKISISLAAQIYNPAMSDAELKATLREVMNHEGIHAVKGSGLFTDSEYQNLVNAAKQQKFVDRNNRERKFSYFDRAKKLYPLGEDVSVELQEEEAVAELFRDWAAGRKKIGGRPLSLFTRIINFFKSLGKTLD